MTFTTPAECVQDRLNCRIQKSQLLLIPSQYILILEKQGRRQYGSDPASVDFAQDLMRGTLARIETGKQHIRIDDSLDLGHLS